MEADALPKRDCCMAVLAYSSQADAEPTPARLANLSYSQNSLEGGLDGRSYRVILQGSIVVTKGDTRS